MRISDWSSDVCSSDLTRRPTSSGLPEGKARAATLDELLRQSDFIVVVLPLTAQTEGMIGPNEFALMKPEAILINVARGPIVQETALLDALDQGRLRAAGLDVFDVEPLPQDSPLRDHPKVLRSEEHTYELQSQMR